MKRVTYIVTGTSKGLGKAIVERLVQDGNQIKVVSLGRSFHTDHVKYLHDKNLNVHFIEVDLSDTAMIKSKLKKLKNHIDKQDKIVFINNAASINPVNKIGAFREDDIIASININVVTPFMIINQLMKWFGNQEMIFLNISSGAANRPIDGWATYCAGKAYAKMLFDVLHEQTKESNKIQVLQLDPGVMDTGMQEQIRNADITVFPDRQMFIDYKDNQKLKTPGEVADSIISTIDPS